MVKKSTSNRDAARLRPSGVTPYGMTRALGLLSAQQRDRVGKRRPMATKAKRKSNLDKISKPDGLLASAARTMGHAAGTAAKALGLDNPDSGIVAAPAKSKRSRTKAPKTRSARVYRKNQAEAAKSAAKSLFPKGSAQLGAPYRRIMGKPAANWTEKDLEYITVLVAKHGK
jgi:hypothetical protein